ncbi:MAG: DUF805 domain-containing protein [Deltaproteobacteria bacterium]|jgi:uncharacterized membrane protein YhaH (DUF805 family)|nr:DUF805 domain-containing protein [Deltaproteobacteria bacterium]
MDWYLKVLNKYAVFEGRARRKEYWMFVLFNIIISFVISLLEQMAGMQISVLSLLYSIFILIPGLAVSVRRLHDTNKSGWFILLSLIPIAGFIILLIFFAEEGNSGPNRFGPSPK